MDIEKIWVSQRKLRRAGQIPAMIKSLEIEHLPAIMLERFEDESVQLRDGHHRLAAIWLSGRRKLEDWEYIIVESDQWRPRFGKVEDLIG